jgi:hypothetical protein
VALVDIHALYAVSLSLVKYGICGIAAWAWWVGSVIGANLVFARRVGFPGMRVISVLSRAGAMGLVAGHFLLFVALHYNVCECRRWSV